MIRGKWLAAGDDMSEALRLRRSALGRGRDALDDTARQAVALADGRAVGAARLWWADGAFWLGDVCVEEAQRGKGFGDLLARMLIFMALEHGARELRLVAPPSAAPFFARYGFAPVGPRGTDGVEMLLPASRVTLSHCGGDCARCAHPSDACAPSGD